MQSAPSDAAAAAYGDGSVAPHPAGGYKGHHPVAGLFHIGFKLLAFLVYLIGGLIASSTVGIFISTVLLLAADFWVTKNVTGRLLVGLRWWNRIKDDGESEWIFECHPNASKIHEFDSYFFWVVTYGNCIAWLLLTVFNLMSISKLPMCLLGLSLGAANALGYLKCSRDQKKRFTSFVAQQAMSNPGLVATAVAASA